jgi:3-hydroxyisobutyrate dehydrogenase-like beta-hydroxyacid dehydrogenase
VKLKGGLFLDAPVAGSKAPAENGSLVFLCSGEKKVYDQVQTELKAMGKADFFFGEAGQGTKIKLLVNMLMATNMAAFAETIALCKALDLHSADLLKVLELSAIGCPMYGAKGNSMAARDYSTAFPLKHAQKDVR